MAGMGSRHKERRDLEFGRIEITNVVRHYLIGSIPLFVCFDGVLIPLTSEDALTAYSCHCTVKTADS